MNEISVDKASGPSRLRDTHAAPREQQFEPATGRIGGHQSELLMLCGTNPGRRC
ncbi:hypothetical protein BURKHO8Y_120194 [Burkholderia sp. 8Y]|nr:hypothetical protein BURKHO8Y_120194 [Burkholderia sp. 8Y]